jgi:hypothetical protein
MSFVVPREPGVASLPRCAAAGAINAACMLVAGGALLGSAAGIAAASGHSGELHGWIDRSTQRKLWSHPALTGAFESLELTGRNWRSPGTRAAGIRRVDARTGGPVSVRSASIALVLQRGKQRIYSALDQPANARAEARQRAANDEIDRMRASRPDEDSKQLMIDAAEVRQRHGASTCTWMLPRMLARTAVDLLPALWSGRRQSLYERLSGTVFVLDR